MRSGANTECIVDWRDVCMVTYLGETLLSNLEKFREGGRKEGMT